ncbi:MAG: hypothetical protein V3S20_07050, partial [Dehalococcoidia bacterium]
MDLSGLLSRIAHAPSLARLLDDVGRRPLRLTAGVPDTAKAVVVASLARAVETPLLAIVPREDRADALADELSAWLGETAAVVPFPQRDALPYERLTPDPEAVRQRLMALLPRGGCNVIIASAMALAQRTLSPQEMAASVRVLGPGSRLEPEEFLARLSALGYAIEPLVERPGQASRRGGIIDVFPPQAEAPVRIELVGREIESLRRFDPASQRSVETVESVALGPVREVVLPAGAEPGTEHALARLDFSRCTDEARERFREEISLLEAGVGFAADSFYVPFLARATLLDHLPPETVIILDEESEVAAALDEAEREADTVRREMEERGELPRGLPLPQQTWRELRAAIDDRQALVKLSRWASGEEADCLRLPFSPAAAYGGQLRRFVSEGVSGLRQGGPLAIVSQQAQRLAEMFRDEGTDVTVTAEPSSATGLALVQGSLPAGWRLSEDGVELTLITDTEVFGFAKQRRRAPRKGIN